MHAISNIIKANVKEIEEKCRGLGPSVKVIVRVKMGMDGSGNQSEYNQQLNLNIRDKSLFVVTLVVLRIELEADGREIYINPSPNSDCSVFVYKMIWEKETEELIKTEFDELEKSMAELELDPIQLPSGNLKL
jgi:hypothetical protein